MTGQTPSRIHRERIIASLSPEHGKPGFRLSGAVNHTDDNHIEACSRCHQVTELKLWEGLDATGNPIKGKLCFGCFLFIDAASAKVNQQSPSNPHPSPDAEVASATVSVPAAKPQKDWATGKCTYCGWTHNVGEECPKVLVMEGRSDDY